MLKSHRWAVFLTCLGILLAATIPLLFAAPAEANHPSACLDVEPETDTNPVGTVHTMTATLRTPKLTPPPSCAPAEQAVNATSTVKISFEITGPNDADGDTPDTPDLSCLILTGTSSCVAQYLGNLTGTDTIRGWIDHDGGSPPQQCGAAACVTEADRAEGRDELTAPGTGCTGMPGENLPEPDCTDVVTKTWNAGEPDRLDCDDANGPDTERETNPHAAGAQSNEVYTCQVVDEFGNLTTDTAVRVNGEHKDGVNDPENPDQVSYEPPDHFCTTKTTGTSDRGQCTITVTQADGETGTTQICFWIESYTFGGNSVDNDGATLCANETTEEGQLQNGSDTANDKADQVEKTWEQRRASSVDAEPETDTNPTGSNHTIHVFVYDQFGSTFQSNTTVNFEFFQGSPTDTDNNTPSSPDRTCTTNNSNTCSITYTSQNAGTDLVCAWVGATPNMQGNNTNGTCDGESLNDADDEPSQSNPPTGDAPEPANDDQDVVQKTWQNPNAATRLDCEPETDTNPTGSSHTVTCTARNASNSTVSQTQIDAEATGANDPDNSDTPTTPDFSCTTGSDGVCSFTHGPSGTGTTSNPGMTTYRAWIDSDNNNNSTEADPTEAQDQNATPGQRAEIDDTDVVTKTWQGPTPSPSASGTPTPTPTPTPTSTSTPTPEPECSDGADNDGDGEIDHPNDPGCESATDDSESPDPFVPRGCRNAGSDQNVFVGTSGSDVMKGTSDSDVMCGAGGDDVMSGLGGADLMLGNGGNDAIKGGGGKDSLSGNAGDDNLSGNRGNDAIKGNAGNDSLKGNKGIDSLTGGGGNDTLQGGDNEDILKGGRGNDTLRGGASRDQLDGGPGRDQCTGGAGRDDVTRCE